VDATAATGGGLDVGTLLVQGIGGLGGGGILTWLVGMIMGAMKR
jgi:hypothetical protein